MYLCPGLNELHAEFPINASSDDDDDDKNTSHLLSTLGLTREWARMKRSGLKEAPTLVSTRVCLLSSKHSEIASYHADKSFEECLLLVGAQ